MTSGGNLLMRQLIQLDPIWPPKRKQPCSGVHGQITPLADSFGFVPRGPPGRFQPGFQRDMADVLAAPQQAKADSALRTLTAISIAHWLSHFHLFVLPMLFPFLKAQLGVGYIELGFALTVFDVVSGLTQAPIG